MRHYLKTVYLSFQKPFYMAFEFRNHIKDHLKRSFQN